MEVYMANTKRQVEEKSENLETVTNEAPSSKLQDGQQIAKSTGFKTDSGASSFVPEKRKTKGSALKQEVAASVLKDPQLGGSLSGDGASFNGMRSSGSMGGVLGGANATPVAGKARTDSRTGKKLDRNSTKLNYIPSEQVLIEWDESKPLAESADEDQGFNGTYRNEFARTQKNKEAVPGALMFDRSLDLIAKDNIYFGEGQKISQSGVTTDEDLTVTIDDSNDTTAYGGGATGSYLCESVNIQLDKYGVPAYTIYNEADLSATVDQYEANKSGAQDIILRNNAELVRETMDTKAGDEKADIWTPLARAVDQPTQLVGFLRDIEAGVGDEVVTAYRKASTSLSFQLNRAHKDGQDAINPGILALLGMNKNYISSAAAQAALPSTYGGCFARSHYLNGEASTMIALYDSVAKYNTKADLLIQPRSFRMALQTADNNIDPLHTSRLFQQAYDAQEVFSTIDRDYDPTLPVCISDKAGVAHRISWHKMGSFIYDKIQYSVQDSGSTSRGNFTLVPAKLAAEIKNAGLNIYVIYAKETVGSMSYTSGTGKVAITSTYEFANDDSFTVVIAGSTPTYDSSTEALVSIANADINTTAGILFDGTAPSNHKFAVHDLTILSDAKKVYAYLGGPAVYMYSDLRNNYKVSVEHPLTEGIDKYFRESIGSKYHSLIVTNNDTEANAKHNAPIKITTVHSTMYFSLWSFILCAATPYIIKSRINSFRDILYYEKNVEYPFADTLIPVRDIMTKSYSNFNYVNYDSELETKLMLPSTSLTWMLPELYQQVGYASSESKVLLPWYSNQKDVIYLDGSYKWNDDASAMSMPSIRSGVRFKYLDNLYGMTEKDIRLSCDMISSFKNLSPTLSNSATYKYSSVGDGQLILSVAPSNMIAINIMKLPRQLGFFMTAPYGTLTPDYNHNRSDSTTVLGTSSFRAYYWFGKNPTTTGDQGTETILSAITVNVNRAANFKQDWYCVLASGTIPATDHGFFLSSVHGLSSAGALLAGRTSFKPYATLQDVGSQVTSYVNPMMSLQKIFWTRIQKLPFILSPFDGLTLDNTGTPNNVVLPDPYDFLYFFGLGGFRASDFRESVYNREKQVVNQGILFASDPWIEDSPVFKEGSASSGVSYSKGFEL